MARWRLTLLVCIASPILAGCSLLPFGAGNDAPGDSGPPKTGSCFSAYVEGPIDRAAVTYVPCGMPHDNEVIGVGSFGPEGSTAAGLRDAYEQCDEMTRQHVSAQWRDVKMDDFGGWLETRVSMPASSGESGGERWWDCSVSSMDDGFPREWFDTAAVTFGSAERIGCRRAGKSLGYFADTLEKCSVPHNGEHAGWAFAPAGTPYPSRSEQTQATQQACRPVVAKYVGVDESRVQVYALPVHSEHSWSATLDLRCFAYTGDVNITGSVQNTAGKGLPW
jgi:hypothetical protein